MHQCLSDRTLLVNKEKLWLFLHQLYCSNSVLLVSYRSELALQTARFCNTVVQ